MVDLQNNERLQMPDAEVYYWPDFFSAEQSATYLQKLIATVAWRQENVKIFGKQILLPRLTAWYGDPGKLYSYSGIQNHPQPWTDILLEIKRAVEVPAKVVFNSVLLNYYRHNQDSMGWHADDEPELGLNPVIASVSLGQARRFNFRHRINKSLPKVSVLLSSGSLLLMQGTTQHFWQHQVPKISAQAGVRLNLTFRVIA
jgi:alkylated DNA repair dioxygenase AlkB